MSTEPQNNNISFSFVLLLTVVFLISLKKKQELTTVILKISASLLLSPRDYSKI